MDFRSLVIALFILVILGSPAWAIFCSGCGAIAPENDKFCGQCGKPLPGVEIVPVSFDMVSSTTNLAAPPSPQAYQITSYYLLINGYRVSRKNFFWIAEIKEDRARIWCMNEPPMYGLIMGWVS